MTSDIESSLIKLGGIFSNLNWDFRHEEGRNVTSIVSYWPGNPSDDVMVCVLKSDFINEPFHRQDFFFFNYAYQGNYSALSMNDQNLITVHENGCYIGQPFNGYALRSDPKSGEIIIIGILIQRETFLHEYLSTISSDSSLLRFFLEPQSNPFSESFIRLSFGNNLMIRKLLELMVQEYANPSEDTQLVLKPLVLSLLMLIARVYRNTNLIHAEKSIAEQMKHYITSHINTVSLFELSEKFSYHPNYVSSLLRSETGKSFSEILLAERMKRASILLKKTTLSIEEVSSMSGYKDTRNFYKAFRKYYGVSPREYG